ncbi:MAG: AarF/ABC1/UbiB kinase family protein [Deltaproteobacteria bacterium]|nr:AarF/ABC1/UbiB kinase family protein [Deltaproteobacteria bacterium]
MKVLSTATNISQAFKNVGRLSEVLGVLVRHGFADIVHRMKLSRFMSAKFLEDPRHRALPVPQRLRLSFEELGPAFVKLGQLLATRADLLPDSYVEEFTKLQDNVGTVPFSEISSLLEAEAGAPLNKIFSHFDERPIAAASIAQVHGAELASGEKVAVKVQRPGIDKIIHNDISILRGLAILLERYIPELKPFNPTGMVEEFVKTIEDELDFRVEANNIRRIRKNMEGMPTVVIPRVFGNISTGRILVLERFDGIRFSDREAIIKAGIKPMEIIQAGAEAFLQMVMFDGVFHGDLHAGNLFVLPDGKIGIIDFGIVGRLPRKVQDSIITMFMSIVEEDYDTLATEYINLCQVKREINIQALQRDLMDAISPYLGMALGEVNIGRVLIRSTAIAVKHELEVPRELMLLFKAIVTIEALGKKLDPTFDLLPLGTKLARQTLSRRYSKERIIHDLIVVGRDVQNLVEISPRIFLRFLKRWSQNDFAIDLRNRDTQELARSIRVLAHIVALSIGALIWLVIAVAFFRFGYGPHLGQMPLGGIVATMLSLWLAFYAGWISRRRLK